MLVIELLIIASTYRIKTTWVSANKGMVDSVVYLVLHMLFMGYYTVVLKFLLLICFIELTYSVSKTQHSTTFELDSSDLYLESCENIKIIVYYDQIKIFLRI